MFVNGLKALCCTLKHEVASSFLDMTDFGTEIKSCQVAISSISSFAIVFRASSFVEVVLQYWKRNQASVGAKPLCSRSSCEAVYTL